MIDFTFLETLSNLGHPPRNALTSVHLKSALVPIRLSGRTEENQDNRAYVGYETRLFPGKTIDTP
jgi:hypothetical protein